MTRVDTIVGSRASRPFIRSILKGRNGSHPAVRPPRSDSLPQAAHSPVIAWVQDAALLLLLIGLALLALLFLYRWIRERTRGRET